MKRLYNALYVPLRRYVHTDNLIIVPHGELHYLPFGALTNGVRYLVELYTISYLPSASTLSRIHGKSTIMDTDVLILGNPDTTEGSVPGAEQEALAIGALFDVEPLLRKDATERALFLQASDAAIIHIAAHGNLDPVDPMTSTIYLAATPGSDGRLTVKDIFSLDLHENTDLVSLSGCETKVGNTGTSSTFRAGSEGDDLIVLNRAFMVAGASSVVASLWSVDDEATVPILTQFYENIRDGMGKAEALRSAQITVRHNYPEFAHPRYWAAFVLTGDGK